MKKGQQRAQRKQSKREQKKRQQRHLQRSQGKTALLRAAARWPLYECMMTKDWQSTGTIIQITVARRSPAGEILCGVFLVDLGCLGVKNAFPSKVFSSVQDYRRDLFSSLAEHQEMVPVDLNLAAKVIREAVAYARSLGFAPNRDYADTALLLGEADPDACDVPIPLGSEDGKPFFIAGPYDNVPRILAQLRRAVGEGNFYFLAPLVTDFGDEEDRYGDLDSVQFLE